MSSPYHTSLIALPEFPEYSSTEKLCTTTDEASSSTSSTSKSPIWYHKLTKKPPTTTTSKNSITTLSRTLSQSLSRSLSHKIPKLNKTTNESDLPKLRRVPTPYPEESKPTLIRTLIQHISKNPLSGLRKSLTNCGLPKLSRGLSQKVCSLRPHNEGYRNAVPTHCSRQCWCKDISLDPEVRFAWEYLFRRAHDLDTGAGWHSGGSSVYEGKDGGSVIWKKEFDDERDGGGDVVVDAQTDRDVGVEDYKRCVVLEEYGRMAS